MWELLSFGGRAQLRTSVNVYNLEVALPRGAQSDDASATVLMESLAKTT